MSSTWRARAEHQLTQAWLSNNLLSALLLPITAIYCVLAAARRGLFQTGIRKSTRIPVKVVVVGNVVAGGAGKTPTVISLVERLAREGHQIGVISRGYGRISRDILEVSHESATDDVGDEPLLIHRRLQIPVFVGRDRVAAALQLLQKYPQVNLIVCDDGIQHLQLFRDAEVYVFDNRGIGNGLPLPSGPLRSPWPPRYIARAGQSAAKSIVLHTGTCPTFDGHHALRALAPRGLRSNGTSIALDELRSSSKSLVAIAGIAQPSVFFAMLEAAGIRTIMNISYPDHHDFADWIPPEKSECTVVCTEKDAAKIWLVDPNAVAIPLDQSMADSFFDSVRSALELQAR
ncbi:MAG: tetraacyldisaccharide 4'-kinase [Rhodoferax sp.]|nr:MAG: tetraacyldisaccharide 4'-kinase [Rhodoferax sp.]